MKKKKNIGRLTKQITAGVLSAAMIFTTAPYLGGMEAKAAMLPENTDLLPDTSPAVTLETPDRPDGDYSSVKITAIKGNNGKMYTFGNSESTAYAFGVSSNSTNYLAGSASGSPLTFNIGAITSDAAAKKKTKGYYDSYTSGNYDPSWVPTVKSAFGTNWWYTYYGFGGSMFDSPVPSTTVDPLANFNSSGAPTSATGPTATYESFMPSRGNGGVTSVSAPGGGNIEVRTELRPTDDNENLMLKYTVYNDSSNNQDFWIGNETDTEMYDTDHVPITISSENHHLYMQDFSSGTYGNSTFEVKVSGADEARVWGGRWSDTVGVSHSLWAFSKNKDPETYIYPGDSAGAFSFRFKLAPHQMKSGTAMISTRAAVYYVDPSYTGPSTGFQAKPFKNINDAVTTMQSRGLKKGYIYLTKDVTVDSPITIPAGLNLQIESSPYDENYTASTHPTSGYNKLSSNPESTATRTIKRASSFTNDSLFKVTDSESTLNLYNVKVDGDGSGATGVTATAPLISVSNGKLKIKQRTDITNAKVSGDNVASAISISGNGQVIADPIGGSASVSGNISTDNGSAVIIDAGSTNAHPLVVASNINITGNQAFNGEDINIAANAKNANVNLNNSTVWVESGKTLDGSIGVSVASARLPQSDSQATLIADYADRANPAAPVPFSSGNFTADVTGQTSNNGNTSDTVPAGDAKGLVVGTNQNAKLPYLSSQQFTYTVSFENEDGDAVLMSDLTRGTETIPGVQTANPAMITFTASPGSDVSIPLPTYAGHAFDTVSGSVAPFVVNATTGNITGKTPGQNVDIVIKYKSNLIVYKFDSRGGSNVPDRTEGVTGAPSIFTTLPTPTKNFWVFDRWHTYTDGDGDNAYTPTSENPASTDVDTGAITALPAATAAGVVHLYATWLPGPTLFPITTVHKNTNAALTLRFGQETDAGHQMTTSVDKFHATIPGYRYHSGAAVPSSAGTVAPNPARPTDVDGQYHVDSMPASGITLTYRYAVDPSQTFTYTVKHQDAAGNDLVPPVTSTKRAEQGINAMPDTSIVGYSYSTYSVTAGWNDDPTNYVLGLNYTNPDTGSQPYLVTNDTTSGSFVGFMPNQDVTIVYKYNADGGSNLTRRYYDRVTSKFLASSVEGITPGGAIAASIPTLGSTVGDKLYGYLWDASSTGVVDPAGQATINPANGDMTGTMPLVGNGVRGDFNLSRDASKWRNVQFAVTTDTNYNHGSINPLPAGAPTQVLVSDGTPVGNAAAYNFNRLKLESYVPTTSADRYYMFEGWYMDAAATIPVVGTSIWNTDTTPITIYAKFVEDPSQWFDINFVAGSNGSISAPATLHVPYDYTWNQIASQLPTATPVANYIFNGWKDPNGTPMQATSTLTNHATYTAIFSQDPNTWGTSTGNITPTGRIGNDGSGEIVIDGTTPGNVYVISDPNGNIVAVVPGDSVGNRTVVPNLIPGAHYNVQEGTPDTHATVGQPISSITGTSVSTPQDVYVPTVDSNYNIGYDPDNDGMAQIVINPADPDADYALIDENGNVVPYPGSDNGWMTPVGNNPSTVTFNNLNPNETYTVVARKKGDSSIPNPLTKLSDGNQIIANPGDMADAPKYVVETKYGDVVSVGTTSVGNDTYDQAKTGETVTIHADPVNANGKNFLYWQVLAGRAVGVSGKITQADYTFTLSNSNIVLKAVYEPTKIAGDDADLTETIRGGSAGEFGLDPNQIPGLANTLTTPLDRSLNSVNGANIEYKVVFNKRDAKTNEKTAVKPVSISGIDHPDAHTTAYGLDIQLERYVNGRLVNNGIVATASNATVDVTAQLPAEDVDQLDYQLYDVTPDNAGNITPVEVTITTDVANNAGLLKFTGNLQHSYVLVYSKTFKVTFIDNKPVLDNLHLNDTSRNFYKKFKVRRKESVEDSYYSSDYAAVTAYAQNDVANALVTPFEDIYGVQYDYKNWSKKEDKLSVYDTTSPVTKRTIVYAYYSDNRKEVAKARVDLGDTIDIAKDLTGDPYLKVGEVAEINEAIAHALETLRQARDLVAPDGTTYLRQANWAELQQAIDALRAIINKYSKGSSDRAAARNRRTGGASGGGNSSSGRGSKLLMPGEKSQQNTAINEGSNVRAFVLGVDGNWERNSVTGGWSFVLNGGTPINDMWGMITFDDNTGKKVSRWYYFDGRSTMATGWVYDSKNGNWYYMNTNEGPDIGQMVRGWVKDPKTNKWYYMNDNTGILVTGWHLDKQDGRWYYLNSNGEMVTGWQNIGGKWYYFNTNTPEKTYEWDAAAFKWNYLNNSARPYGSMYAGEKTPDGYSVDANGAWN